MQEDAQSLIDTSTPHPARRYDYWLGGKDNFAADRISGDQIAAAFPAVRTWALENRAFMRRAVAFLAHEHGIRQFLDVGTGIPTSPNLHEVVQAITPDSRVVYVDNDPIVLSHARALLSSSPEGKTAYLDADFRSPGAILGSNEVADVLDLKQPVALTLIALLHFVQDSARPYELVRDIVDALPAGSFLALSHMTFDYVTPEQAKILQNIGRNEGQVRGRAEFERFFEGLEVIAPGVSLVSEWLDDRAERPDPSEVSCYAAVARIP